jgi:hypothetical protein
MNKLKGVGQMGVRERWILRRMRRRRHDFEISEKRSIR